MTTNPEMILLNYCEIHGHAESARILRKIVDKQRQAEVDALPLITRTYEFNPKDYATPHSDTDAHPENQGCDLFAANAGIAPEQARFAYDHAIDGPDPLDMAEEGMAREQRARQDMYQQRIEAQMAKDPFYAKPYDFDKTQEGPPQAVPCDSSAFDRDFSILRADQASMEAEIERLRLMSATKRQETSMQLMAGILGAHMAMETAKLGCLLNPNISEDGLRKIFGVPAKHRWVRLDGTPRQEPCCK